MMILQQKGLTQPIASIRLSLAFTQCNLRDDAMCTTRRYASTSLRARLRNPSATYFQAKQVIRSQRVSRTVLTLSVLWHNRQTKAYMVLRPKPRNYRGDFEAQITKPELSVLRPKLGNRRPWF
jgi:hypothetical protein